MAEIEDVMDKLDDVMEKLGEIESKQDEDRIVYTQCSHCNASGMIDPPMGCSECEDGFRMHGKTGKVG